MRASLAAILLGLAAACASPAPRPSAPAPAAPDLSRFAPEVRAAIRERRVEPGMDGEAVRLAWGEPDSVERTPSAAAAGLEYQRWSWRAGPYGPARFAWLAGGRVLDVLVAPAGAAPTAPRR